MNTFGNVIIIFGCLLHTSYSTSNSTSKSREHKIHNIVLYPDKHSWCTTTAIVQVVGHPGCNTVKIDNNVCVGACFSYIVPKTIPGTPGDVLPYCDSCQPDKVSWRKINLECTEGTYKNQNLTKHVQLIHECTCGTCSDQLTQWIRTNDEPTTEKPSFETDLLDESTIDETPDLVYDRFSNVSLPSEKNTADFKNVISGLLKTLNNENENILEDAEAKGLHKNVWKQLLDRVEAMNSSMDTNSLTLLIKSTLTDENKYFKSDKKVQIWNRCENKVWHGWNNVFMTYETRINVHCQQTCVCVKVEEETKVKFNYKRLKQALMKFKKYQVITKEHTKNDEIFEPQSSSPFSSTEGSDRFGSGLYSKLLHKLPSTGIEEETASPLPNIATGRLEPSTSGLEITHHDNVETNISNRIIMNEKKIDPTTNFSVPEIFNRTS